jgi:hypothetical protein
VLRVVAILAWIARASGHNTQQHGCREQQQNVSFPIHRIKLRKKWKMQNGELKMENGKGEMPPMVHFSFLICHF